MDCPICKQYIKIKPNGNGRCNCGSHIKIIDS